MSEVRVIDEGVTTNEISALIHNSSIITLFTKHIETHRITHHALTYEEYEPLVSCALCGEKATMHRFYKNKTCITYQILSTFHKILIQKIIDFILNEIIKRYHRIINLRKTNL